MSTRKKQGIILTIGLLATVAVLLVSSAVLYCMEETIRVAKTETKALDGFLLSDLEYIEDMGEVKLSDLRFNTANLDGLENVQIDFEDAPNLDASGDKVPEPATLSLLGIGGIALLRSRRRRRKE